MEPYFETDRGKLFNIDCAEFMRALPEKYIDLTITSPPYDNLRDYGKHEWNFEIFKPIARELFRVTKKGGVVVWIVGDATINGSETGTSFRQALYFKECGFNLHDTMIYKKHGAPLNHNRYEQHFEYMFVMSREAPKTVNHIKIPCKYFGVDSDRTGQLYAKHSEKNKKIRSGKSRGNIKSTKIKGNIWQYSTGSGNSTKDKIAFQHPAIFPEKLAADHIISWSNEEDLILDPFNGSGTVPKQAELLKRKWLACEIFEKYCEIAAKRIYTAANQMSF
jgi:site-specific DNA-methyltransferase (adenine-specific)